MGLCCSFGNYVKFVDLQVLWQVSFVVQYICFSLLYWMLLKLCVDHVSFFPAGMPLRVRTGLRRSAHASIKAHSARLASQQFPLEEEPADYNPDIAEPGPTNPETSLGIYCVASTCTHLPLCHSVWLCNVLAWSNGYVRIYCHTLVEIAKNGIWLLICFTAMKAGQRGQNSKSIFDKICCLYIKGILI